MNKKNSGTGILPNNSFRILKDLMITRLKQKKIEWSLFISKRELLNQKVWTIITSKRLSIHGIIQAK